MPEPNAFSQTLALFTPIHKDGYKFVAAAIAVTVIAFLISSILGLLCLAAAIVITFFFRDPQRVVPSREGLIVAPADGTIISIGTASSPQELGFGGEPRTRISIFLSVLDVHVTRAPAGGRIEASVYRPGMHYNAAAAEAPALNESHAFAIETKDAVRLGVVLVAGTVARRIVTPVKEGDAVEAGERLGIIRFGSRVDVYLPVSPPPPLLVAEGQRTVAGETVIADLGLTGERRVFRRI
ncbi:MAG: phosphatidylserine decarboxylase [Rhodomicrobium sp.]